MFFNFSLVSSETTGQAVAMQVTHPKHLKAKDFSSQSGDKVLGNFSDALSTAFWDVNRLQKEADTAVQQMVIAPETIDIHEVTIAMAKAEESLNFMKTVSERVIHAYRELSQMR
jgi:flagellar hook-basal body complex protein FliE